MHRRLFPGRLFGGAIVLALVGTFGPVAATRSHASSPPPGDAGGPGAVDFVITGHDRVWDVDGVLANAPDTLIVPVGARVLWHRAVGLHTITNGSGLTDPAAGSLFDYLLDEVHADFDTTFNAPDTIRFFCGYHEPDGRGVLVISTNADVPDPPLPATLAFTRFPQPNPAHGGVLLTVGLPEAQVVALDIRDVQGRQVASLFHGTLPRGEHEFRWKGVFDDGRLAPAGIYFAWLTDGQRVISHRLTLLH